MPKRTLPVTLAPGLEVSAAAAEVLTCPECGALLFRTSGEYRCRTRQRTLRETFWGCPSLHGKLFPPGELVLALMAAGFKEADAEALLDELKRRQGRPDEANTETQA